VKKTEIQIWFKGMLVRVFTGMDGKWDISTDIIKAYLVAWNGGIVILHNHEQTTFSPDVSRLYKKRTLHRIGLDELNIC